MVLPQAARALVVGVLMLLPVAAGAQQAIDEEYGKQIKQFTTEPFFLTPLIDHLPKSDKVPTPLAVLGHIAGAKEVLSYPEEIYRYLRAVDAASERVKVFNIGTTEEGREMILVVVADEQTIANLDQYKEQLRKLADPRKLSSAEAERIIQQAKPVYWATGAIHSPETGSPEMLMELVYRLAVSETPLIKQIRANVIFMTTPVVEVDGRAKVVDIHMARRKDPKANVPNSPLYWGKYVAHDNNRDNLGLSLKLSQNVTRTFLDWNPTILHDLHESASYLYTSTGRGPYNAWIDPIVVNEWNRLAYKEVKELTALGVPGIYTFDFYDGWAPNYMMWAANARNSIGRFYETQGSRNAANYIVTTNVERQWHRPNPPLREVVWSIRNNVNLQQSALLIALGEVASARQEFLRNFYTKSARSIAKARNEGPAAYVFPADDPRPGQQARLLRLLQAQGIEVNRLAEGVRVPEGEGTDTTAIPTGSYVVRMDQPFSRMADMLLDKQYYNPSDPSPYDDVGWTLGPLFNTQTVRVEDVALLDADMTLLNAPVRAPGGVQNASGARAFVINYNADAQLASFRFKNRGLRLDAAEQDFEAGGRKFRAGSFIVRNGGNVASILDAAGKEFGFSAYGVREVPSVATHPVALPRVAVMHTWQTTQNEGWLRIGLDEYGIPYDYISVHDVRDEPNLRAHYDVILFGPSSNDARSILRGLVGPRPLPWQKTALTPNLGTPDESPDMRGGLELQGVLNLRRFVEQGGTFLTIQNSSSLPVHFDFAPGIQIRQTQNLWARGGVFRVRKMDAGSPLAYGYDGEMGVYFNTAPVFAEVRGGGGQGQGQGPGQGQGQGQGQGPGRGQGQARASADGSTTARRSGRGGMDEQDVPQGRARDLGKETVEEFRKEAREREEQEQQPQQQQPTHRIVLRFHPEVEKLLISGGLQNGQELANAPALVDAPLEKGHVVLFSFNPFWRGETQGSYAFLFNALLHHGSLDAGKTVPAAPPAVTTETGNEN